MATLKASLRPDPSFYTSAKAAMEAAPEKIVYISLLNPATPGTDALAVADVEPGSSSYGQIVSTVNMPFAGDELHHFGWNACSSCLCPHSPHPHMERRYLIVPGLRSSRIHVLDVKPDPRKPRVVKVIERHRLSQYNARWIPMMLEAFGYAAYCAPIGSGVQCEIGSSILTLAPSGDNKVLIGS